MNMKRTRRSSSSNRQRVRGVAVGSMIRTPAAPNCCAAGIKTTPVDARGAELAAEIARLHDRLRPDSRPSSSRRAICSSSNGPRREPGAVCQRYCSRARARRSAGWRARACHRLGMLVDAEDRRPNGPVRTAIANGQGPIFLVKDGERGRQALPRHQGRRGRRRTRDPVRCDTRAEIGPGPVHRHHHQPGLRRRGRGSSHRRPGGCAPDSRRPCSPSGAHGADGGTLCHRTHRGHAREIAHRHPSSAARGHVMAWGGDGTVSEVASGAGLHLARRSPIVPAGSGNGLARELGVAPAMTHDPSGAGGDAKSRLTQELGGRMFFRVP